MSVNREVFVIFGDEVAEGDVEFFKIFYLIEVFIGDLILYFVFDVICVGFYGFGANKVISFKFIK